MRTLWLADPGHQFQNYQVAQLLWEWSTDLARWAVLAQDVLSHNAHVLVAGRTELEGLAVVYTRPSAEAQVSHLHCKGGAALRGRMVTDIVDKLVSLGYASFWAVNRSGAKDSVWARAFRAAGKPYRIGTVMEFRIDERDSGRAVRGSETTQSSQSTSQSSSAPINLTPEAFQNLQSTLASTLSNLFTNTPQLQTPTFTPGANEASTLGNLQGATAPGTNPAWQTILQTLGGGFLPGGGGVPGRGPIDPNLINTNTPGPGGGPAPTAGGVAGGLAGAAAGGGNPYLQAAIEAAQRPTRQALEDTLSRTLPGTFTAAGQTISGGLRSPNANLKPGSTAFDLAAARAFEGGSRALGDIATNLGFKGYEQERNLQSQAVNQALTAGQQDIQALVTNLQAQALPRLLQEQGFDRGAQAFNSMVNTLLQALGIGAGVTRPTIGQVSQAESQSTATGTSETNPNIFGTLFPGGLGFGSK